MQCPQCQHANPAGLTFCNQCGTPLSGHCAACGFTNPPGAKFCGACGTSLTAHGPVPSPVPAAPRQPDPESRFHARLPLVIALLRQEGRVTYRTLTYVFGLDEALLGEIRDDLGFRRLAIDEDGKGLVWTGDTHPAVQPPAAIPRPPATADTTAVVSSPATPTMPPPVTEAHTLSNEPTTPPETVSPDAPQDEPVVVSEPARSAPEAERRQLTVMFCDLADSTRLS